MKLHGCEMYGRTYFESSEGEKPFHRINIRQQPGLGLNVHIILGDTYNYVIDTGLGSQSMEPVLQYLQPDKPVIVVNTHYHWDHVWGNAVFAGSVIIAHSLCRQRLEELWEEMIRKHSEYISGDASKCLPNLVFEDGLYFPDDGIRLFYTPGHTLDGISVLDGKDGVLNAGDNIGDDMEHIVPELECDVAIYHETLQRYMDTGADTVVSGHNAVLGSDILRQISACL